jgi:hypothetical protein
MKAATILALVGAANAHQLQWRGPAINFDLASSWSSGVPPPSRLSVAHTHTLSLSRVFPQADCVCALLCARAAREWPPRSCDEWEPKRRVLLKKRRVGSCLRVSASPATLHVPSSLIILSQRVQQCVTSFPSLHNELDPQQHAHARPRSHVTHTHRGF